MPQFSEQQLEEHLAAVGKSLLQPPPSLDELLSLLDQIEVLLSKVEQSPEKSMLNAFAPLMNSLVMDNLLKHSDVDVRVAVASCISEITRITAPDAPYDDDKMKDVFQLIVSSFENLSEKSSRSFEKRATILETVAKVRSCVIMLDLECDQMIIEMFQHFLNAIREDHTDIIFTSMETIMTLVLEESEDISPELLVPILVTLKRNDEAAMPIAKKLAERVLQNSADKLRPYLRQAVKSLETSLDDYSEVVSCVCRENTDTVGHSNESILNDQPVVEGKCTSASPAQDPVTQADKDGSEETTVQDEDPTAIRSPKSVVSNGGIKETGNEEIMIDANSPKSADSNCHFDAKSNSKTESDDDKPVSSEDKPVSSEDKPEVVESQQEIPDKDVHLSPTEVKPVEEAKSDNKVEDGIIENSLSKEPENEPVVVAFPIQSGSHPDESLSESDILGEGKGNLVNEEIVSDTISKKASEGESILEAKKKHHLGEKQTDDSADKTLTEEVVSKNDCESDILAKGKGDLISEEIVSATASKKASEGDSVLELKKKRRFGKKRTDDDSADNDKTLTEEVVSKKDGESDISGKGKGNLGKKRTDDSAENEISSTEEVVSKKDDESDILGKGKGNLGKGKGNLRKKKTDDSAENDRTLTEEVVSKKDDESDILGKGKGNLGKGKGNLGKKKTDDSAENDRTLTEEVVSKKDDESDILGKGKGNLVSEEIVSETAYKKASEGESISEAKKKRRLGKKRTDDAADNDKTLTEEVVPKNDESDSKTRSLDQTEKIVDASNKTEYKRKEDGKKSGRAKGATSEKDVRKSSAKEDHGKDIVTSWKSPLKSTKNEDALEETPRTSNKRKQTPGKDKASGLEYGENLVGSIVKVWWPKDRMFYEGKIASFDSTKKKHKVSYTDGDEEVLNLKKERWEFIVDDMVSDGDQEVEHSSHDTSSDMKRKKKGNVNSETSSKRQKVEGSPKSKPKDTAPKSGGKSKDGGKAELESKPGKKSEDDSIKSKDQSQKLGGKGQVDAGKASKDEVAKVSKQDSQRSSKSKGKTPPSGKTPQTKSGSSKAKEIDLMKEKTGESAKLSETAKGKSTDTAKSRESETKGGKKRRR